MLQQTQAEGGGLLWNKALLTYFFIEVRLFGFNSVTDVIGAHRTEEGNVILKGTVSYSPHPPLYTSVSPPSRPRPYLGVHCFQADHALTSKASSIVFYTFIVVSRLPLISDE